MDLFHVIGRFTLGPTLGQGHAHLAIRLGIPHCSRRSFLGKLHRVSLGLDEAIL